MPAKGQFQTQCKHGHNLFGDNLHIVKSTGQRVCRKCRGEKVKRYRLSERGMSTTRDTANNRREKVKKEVLTHYGKGGKLLCCWRGCKVCDIDMLSLDHVQNDGQKHVSDAGIRYLGIRLYRWAKRNGYPETLQTLCFNHQYKKEIVKRKKNRTNNRERDAKRIGRN